MRQKIPNSPFATRLSGSAKEIEMRLHNIFQWKKKRPPGIFIVLTVLAVTACGSLVGFETYQPEQPVQPDLGGADGIPVAQEPLLTEYPLAEIMEQGQKSLAYNDRYEFYIQDIPMEAPQDFNTVSELMCRDAETGNEYSLFRLEYGSDGIFWDHVRLVPFTDVLGCDGFILEYGIGAAYEAYDFYQVTESGASLIASCCNTIFTADLNGDGRGELLSLYGSYGMLDLYWQESGTVHFCTLNETARAYLELPLNCWVTLEAQDGSGLLTARWQDNDSTWQVRELDASTLFEYEQARTEFFDCYYLHTADGRLLKLVLWESGRVRGEWNYRYVEQIQVCEETTEGEVLLQTIDTADLTYDGDYLYEGLFVNKGYVIGEPDIRDFNFDGSEDFGLLAAEAYPHNIPYCYFLWNQETEQFAFSFVLSNRLALDEEEKQLIEEVYRVDPGSSLNRYNTYQFGTDGELILVHREEKRG